MPRTRICDFSGDDIEPGTGIMFIRNDGTVLHFKNSKAEKNYFMGREARNLEWTEAGRRNKGQTVGSQDEVEEVAEDGSTEMDEPEPTADVATPDEESAEPRSADSRAAESRDETASGATDVTEGVEAETPDEEARGDEDEQPVEDTDENTPDLESAEAEVDEEDDEE